MAKFKGRILITGGAGYIGSVLTNLLLAVGYKVRVIDLLWYKREIPLFNYYNPNYEFIRGDISDNILIRKAIKDVDYVVHAAAIVGDPAAKKFPDLTTKINYEASVKLIDSLKGSSVKGLIFLSTCSNYGITDGMATEQSDLKPLSLYAQTKVDVEKYLMTDTTNLKWVICRLSTVYGISPRMRFDLTVNDFTLNAVIKGCLDVFLPYTYRPYIHVFDVARVLEKVLSNFKKVENNVFNVGFNEENYQKIKIAEIIKEFLPYLNIRIIDHGMDLRDYKVDFSKLKDKLKIGNVFTVRDGVSQILKAKIFDNFNGWECNNLSPDLEEVRHEK